jgi:1-acyl-sn-glycerol-3-phosphate acyltransferase
MEAMHCVFIKRSSPRESVAVINRAARQISEGHPMVVFPEGTRSKGPAMAPFRPGSLKLALRSGATIVPVTIDGSYMIYEGNNNRITPAAVNLIIHKPVEVALLTEQERKAISQRLRDIIQSGQWI